MNDWITDMIKSSGYFGLVFLMFVENIFPPIPSEVVVPLAGFLVSQEKLTMVGVIIATTFGSMLGAVLFYYLGYKLGSENLKNWCDKHGKWVAIRRDDVDKAERWIDRYGLWGIFLLRLVPGLRSLISLPAGIVKMPLLSFLVLSTLGSALWNVLLAYAGYYLGSQFNDVGKWTGPISTAIIASLVLWYIWRLIKSK